MQTGKKQSLQVMRFTPPPLYLIISICYASKHESLAGKMTAESLLDSQLER